MDPAEKLAEKIRNGRQYRSMSLEIRSSEEGDDSTKLIVEGYASTFNEPYTLYEADGFRYQEQVDARAFDKTDMSDVIVQYDHQGRVYARSSNGTLAVKPDAHGLWVRMDLSGTEEGRKLYEEIKGGYTTKMSFGFTVRGDSEASEKLEDGTRLVTRTITDVGKLYDVSAVSLPANDGTEISARSLAEGALARLEAERLKAEAEKQNDIEERNRRARFAFYAQNK